MRTKSYIFYVASSDQSRAVKFRVPRYAIHVLMALVVVGGATVLAGFTSYSRMLWKTERFNSVRTERDTLKQQFTALQTTVKDTNQRLDSLQSLATEVAMTYGFMNFRESPFSTPEPDDADADANYEHTVDEFNFLKSNTTASALTNASYHLMPSLPGLGDTTFTPTLWPVNGRITAPFGEREDPFNGEGEFHRGVDISADFGQPVHVTADGIVVIADTRPGYGKLVIVDHGYGTTTYYAHLSNFNSQPGQQVHRGDVIGFAGVSGRATGPHVHYEVRINGAPVNPWRYLRYTALGD